MVNNKGEHPNFTTHQKNKKLALTSILQDLRSKRMKYVMVPTTLTVHAE